MLLLDKLAEARITAAVERGQLDDLPGAGKPLVLDDDTFIAPELRLGYRILKNAGCVPPEVGLRREISQLAQLLNASEDRVERAKAHRKLNCLMTQLSVSRGTTTDLRLERAYFDKLLGRFERE